MRDQESLNGRKLLPGERVEVRQKERGLRGSWHPATIVGLRPGRRLVEYDELLTADGLRKLRECVSIGGSLDVLRGSTRHNLSSPQRKNRGYLRPLPPTCFDPPPQSWKRGFLVDVLYQDAWWEAVLLEDLVFVGHKSSIEVMFPDEGDTAMVPVENLRVSQVWDEDTGQWSAKGACNLAGLLTERRLKRRPVLHFPQNNSLNCAKQECVLRSTHFDGDETSHPDKAESSDPDRNESKIVGLNTWDSEFGIFSSSLACSDMSSKLAENSFSPRMAGETSSSNCPSRSNWTNGKETSQMDPIQDSSERISVSGTCVLDMPHRAVEVPNSLADAFVKEKGEMQFSPLEASVHGNDFSGLSELAVDIQGGSGVADTVSKQTVQMKFCLELDSLKKKTNLSELESLSEAEKVFMRDGHFRLFTNAVDAVPLQRFSDSNGIDDGNKKEEQSNNACLPIHDFLQMQLKGVTPIVDLLAEKENNLFEGLESGMCRSGQKMDLIDQACSCKELRGLVLSKESLDEFGHAPADVSSLHLPETAVPIGLEHDDNGTDTKHRILSKKNEKLSRKDMDSKPRLSNGCTEGNIGVIASLKEERLRKYCFSHSCSAQKIAMDGGDTGCVPIIDSLQMQLNDTVPALDVLRRKEDILSEALASSIKRSEQKMDLVDQAWCCKEQNRLVISKEPPHDYGDVSSKQLLQTAVPMNMQPSEDGACIKESIQNKETMILSRQDMDSKPELLSANISRIKEVDLKDESLREGYLLHNHYTRRKVIHKPDVSASRIQGLKVSDNIDEGNPRWSFFSQNKVLDTMEKEKPRQVFTIQGKNQQVVQRGSHEKGKPGQSSFSRDGKKQVVQDRQNGTLRRGCYKTRQALWRDDMEKGKQKQCGLSHDSNGQAKWTNGMEKGKQKLDYSSQDKNRQAIWRDDMEKGKSRKGRFSQCRNIFNTEKGKQGYLLQHKNRDLTRSGDDAISSAFVNPKQMPLKASLKTGWKCKVRSIAKEALLEAGFRIEFRPRKNKDYQDSVYVSPQGYTYWSLPNAWRAWRATQMASSEGTEKERRTGNSSKAKWLLKSDKKVADSIGSNSGVDENKHKHLDASCKDPLQQTLRDLEFPLPGIRHRQLTKAELTSLFIEDLGLLKRVTQKAKAQMVNSNGEYPFDKQVKRKHISISPLPARKLGFKKSSDQASRDTNSLVLSALDHHEEKQKRKKIKDSVMGRGSENCLHNRHLSCKKTSKVEGFDKKADLQKLEGGKFHKDSELCLNHSKKHSKGGLSDKSRLTIKLSKHKKAGNPSLQIQKCKEFHKSNESVARLKGTICDTIARKRKLSLRDSLLPVAKKNKGASRKCLILQSKQWKDHSGLPERQLIVRPSMPRKGEEPFVQSLENKQTVISWLIDRGVLSEKEKLYYIDRETNRVIKDGATTCDGILCKCCKEIFTIANFEAHAGSKLQRAGTNIVFRSGKSLLDCQRQAWDIENELRKPHNYVGVTDSDRNDDTCTLCGDGGDLICCDNCPSTFHTTCLQIENVPEGNWYCPKCCCAVCGGSQYDAEGVSTCKAPVNFCDQCEREYHTSCVYGGGTAVSGHWFCSPVCGKIFTGLRSLVGTSHAIDGGFSWTLLRCMTEDQNKEFSEDSEIVAEQHSKLAVSLIVMEECFVPMIDPRTNINMISHIVYNRWSEFYRLDYRGFYTVILERGDELISAASIRIHGSRLAEMPLIGTRQQYRRQGMCRRLVNAIEKMLSSLGVELFVLPAIPELLETWTSAFGFHPINTAERLNFKDLSMMLFPGTALLQKSLVTLEHRQSNEMPIADPQKLNTQMLEHPHSTDAESQWEMQEPCKFGRVLAVMEPEGDAGHGTSISQHEAEQDEVIHHHQKYGDMICTSEEEINNTSSQIASLASSVAVEGLRSAIESEGLALDPPVEKNLQVYQR